MITITDEAAAKIKEYLTETTEATGFRIEVRPGGCAGVMLKFGLDNPVDTDTVWDIKGVQVIVDNKAVSVLEGSTLTYVDSLNGAGFDLAIPASTGVCGCGKSKCL